MSESAMQAQVVYELRRFGWLVMHARATRSQRRDGSVRYLTPIQGDPGFPDVVVVRGPRVVFIEFKKTGKYPTAEQRRWRDALIAAGQDWRLVRPADLQGLYEELIP